MTEAFILSVTDKNGKCTLHEGESGDLIARSFTTDRWRGYAQFSEDERHRYLLTWDWSTAEVPRSRGEERCTWIMMNPSTATERQLDPTLRRCARFSMDWGFGGMVILNAYAFRATNPKHCLEAHDRVGMHNDMIVSLWLEQSTRLIVAWGGKLERSRAYEMRKMVEGRNPMCLHVGADGQPTHPLYLPTDTEPHPWTPPR